MEHVRTRVLHIQTTHLQTYTHHTYTHTHIYVEYFKCVPYQAECEFKFKEWGMLSNIIG